MYLCRLPGGNRENRLEPGWELGTVLRVRTGADSGGVGLLKAFKKFSPCCAILMRVVVLSVQVRLRYMFNKFKVTDSLHSRRAGSALLPPSP